MDCKHAYLHKLSYVIVLNNPCYESNNLPFITYYLYKKISLLITRSKKPFHMVKRIYYMRWLITVCLLVLIQEPNQIFQLIIVIHIKSLKPITNRQIYIMNSIQFDLLYFIHLSIHGLNAP